MFEELSVQAAQMLITLFWITIITILTLAMRAHLHQDKIHFKDRLKQQTGLRNL